MAGDHSSSLQFPPPLPGSLPVRKMRRGWEGSQGEAGNRNLHGADAVHAVAGLPAPPNLPAVILNSKTRRFVSPMMNEWGERGRTPHLATE